MRNFTALTLQFVAMRSLILQLLAIYSIRALENPIPSSFLQPRNFNPHPYEIDASKYLLTPGHYEDYQGLGLAQKYHELSRKIQKFVFFYLRHREQRSLFTPQHGSDTISREFRWRCRWAAETTAVGAAGKSCVTYSRETSTDTTSIRTIGIEL